MVLRGKWYAWQFDNLYISWKFGKQKFMRVSYWRMREYGGGMEGHKDLQHCQHSELIFDHQLLQFLITNYWLFLPIQPDAAFVWFSFSRAARTSLLKGESRSHSDNNLKRAYWLPNTRSFMVWATFFKKHVALGWFEFVQFLDFWSFWLLHPLSFARFF